MGLVNRWAAALDDLFDLSELDALPPDLPTDPRRDDRRDLADEWNRANSEADR